MNSSDEFIDSFFLEDSISFINIEIVNFLEPICLEMAGKFLDAANSADKNNSFGSNLLNIDFKIIAPSGTFDVLEVLLTFLFIRHVLQKLLGH